MAIKPDTKTLKDMNVYSIVDVLHDLLGSLDKKETNKINHDKKEA